MSPAVNKIQQIQNLKNNHVLDIGCGYGALCSILSSKGAIVTGVETDSDKLKIARNFLNKLNNVHLFKVKDEKLEFKNNSFDVVFIFDVIEHIKNPKQTINECVRVLKPGGLLYVEFTPYYSITGHHLYDYAKWPIHILPEKIIKKIVFTKKLSSFFTNDYFWNQFKSLNKIRISDFQKMMGKFKIVEERYIIKYPDKFEFNLPFVKYFGIFKDLFTMSFEGIYINNKK